MTAAGVGAFKWGPCVPEIAQPHRYAPQPSTPRSSTGRMVPDDRWLGNHVYLSWSERHNETRR
jgi:hypothetical protein